LSAPSLVRRPVVAAADGGGGGDGAVRRLRGLLRLVTFVIRRRRWVALEPHRGRRGDLTSSQRHAYRFRTDGVVLALVLGEIVASLNTHLGWPGQVLVWGS